MPDIHRGEQPGIGMTLHASLGTLILAVMLLRFACRLAHPVAPESSLSTWQRLSSEMVHWSLYALVLATTLTGWLFASFRGWSVSFLFLTPLPMLGSVDATAARAIDGLHQAMEWTLLAFIVIHVSAALLHILLYRDGVVQRMLR
jgi:cytochrome b561